MASSDCGATPRRKNRIHSCQAPERLTPSSLLKFPVHLRQTLHFGFMGHDAEVIGIDFDPLQLARFETLLMLGPLGFAIGRGCRRLP